MRQLAGVDAAFLHMETARTIGHVAGVYILDPATAPRPVNADTIRLLEPSPEPREVPAPAEKTATEPVPSGWEMLTQGWLGVMGRARRWS